MYFKIKAWIRSFKLIAKSVRVRKILPFVLTFMNACLLRGQTLDWKLLLLEFLVILTSCSIGMKVNIWTDQELDQIDKPHLYALLSQSRDQVLFVVFLESLIFIFAMIQLFRLGYVASAVWIFCFASLFNLYSFNFFLPRRGRESRFKLHWWGNFITAGGGYFALWMSGFSSQTDSFQLSIQSPILFLALFLALSEYAIFLCECATDALAERRYGFKTLPALMGRFGTVGIALGLSLILCVAWIWAGQRMFILFPDMNTIVLAGNWYIAISALTCAALLLLAAGKNHLPRLWDQTVDVSFWAMRIGLLALIVFRKKGWFF